MRLRNRLKENSISLSSKIISCRWWEMKRNWTNRICRKRDKTYKAKWKLFKKHKLIKIYNTKQRFRLRKNKSKLCFQPSSKSYRTLKKKRAQNQRQPSISRLPKLIIKPSKSPNKYKNWRKPKLLCSKKSLREFKIPNRKKLNLIRKSLLWLKP